MVVLSTNSREWRFFWNYISAIQIKEVLDMFAKFKELPQGIDSEAKPCTFHNISLKRYDSREIKPQVSIVIDKNGMYFEYFNDRCGEGMPCHLQSEYITEQMFRAFSNKRLTD